MTMTASNKPEFEDQFRPLLNEIERRSSIAERFIDKDLYRIYIATLWANLALDPADVGITEHDLEPLHEYLNDVLEGVLGAGQTITECFRFVNSKSGESAMERSKLSKTHKDLLLYFCSMILDPEGHKRWADEQRD